MSDYLPGMNPNYFASDCDLESKINYYLQTALDHAYTGKELTTEREKLLRNCFINEVSPCTFCVNRGKSVECRNRIRLDWKCEIGRFGCRDFETREEQQHKKKAWENHLREIRKRPRSWSEEMADAMAKARKIDEMR